MILKFFDRCPQFFRFALIGVLNTLVHGGVLTALVELAHVGVVQSNMVAFAVSNIFSYLMNAVLTFRTVPSVRSYLKFFSASLIALGLNLLISWGMAELGFHYLQGFLVVIVLVPAISFLAIKLWVFSPKKPI
jgi:putative flippase GtrA